VAVRSIPSWQHNSIWSSVNFGNFNKYSSCAREQPSRKIHFPNLAKTKRKQQDGGKLRKRRSVRCPFHHDIVKKFWLTKKYKYIYCLLICDLCSKTKQISLPLFFLYLPKFSISWSLISTTDLPSWRAKNFSASPNQKKTNKNHKQLTANTPKKNRWHPCW